MSGLMISVVIPCFNRAAMIGRAIESALPFGDVVVVDDGSTDGLAEIASGYPVELIKTANRGVSAARNTGWRAAAGDYIRFLDSDDEMIGALEPLPDRQIAVGKARVNPPGMDYGFHEPITREGLFRRVLNAWLPLWPRQALEDVGGFNERLTVSEDQELSVRVSAKGWEFILIDRQVTQLNDHTGDRLSRGRNGLAQLKALGVTALHARSAKELAAISQSAYGLAKVKAYNTLKAC